MQKTKRTKQKRANKNRGKDKANNQVLDLIQQAISKDAKLAIFLENHNVRGKTATIQLVRWSPSQRQVQAVLREFTQDKGQWFNKGFGHVKTKNEAIAELTGAMQELQIIKAWDC